MKLRLIIQLLFFVITSAVYAQGKTIYQTLRAIDFQKSDSVALSSLDSIARKGALPPLLQLELNVRIMVRSYFHQDFKRALSLGKESIEMAKKNNLDSMEASFYEHMGNAYYYLDNRKKAIEYYTMGMDLAEKKGHWEIEAACTNNASAANIDSKNFEEGEKLLVRSIHIMQTHGKGEDPNTFRSLRILATLYSKTGRPEKGEAIYLQFIRRGREKKDTVLLADNLLYYSGILKEKKDFVRAVAMSEEALGYLRKRNDFSDLVQGLNTHAKNLEAVGRSGEAYQLQLEVQAVLKKSFTKNLERQIGEMEVKYKTAELEQKKEFAEKETREQKRTLIIFFSALLAVAGLGTYVFIQRRSGRLKAAAQKQRLEALVEGEEKERSRIARDLHDGIVQSLTAIKLKVDAQAKKDESLSEIVSEIDRAAREVRNISYQMMPVALREYGLLAALEDLLQKALTPNNIKFEFEHVNLEERLPEKIEVCLYRITQELLNNVVKHSQASAISLVLTKYHHSVTLMLEDNGRGFKENEVRKGIGMNSLSSRLEMVNGKLKFESVEGTGTIAIIKIPLSDFQ